MLTTVYHATPKQFNSLQYHSWVSTSQKEAAIHLLMKNIAEHNHIHTGWIISIPNYDTESSLDLVNIGGVTNMTIRDSIPIQSDWPMSFSDFVNSLTGLDKALFNPVEIYPFTLTLSDTNSEFK